MQKQPYDPKLREAMEEIKAVLKKYDCMGTVVLASPTHSEYLFEPSATWSVCWWEGEGEKRGLRFRAKQADYPTREAWHEATEATVHGIESARWISAKLHDQLSGIVEHLGKHMRIASNVSHLMGQPDSVPGDGK